MRRPFRILWLLAAMMVFAAVPRIGVAQDRAPVAEQNFDVPSQPLGPALKHFARTAHLNIAFETGSVSHLRSAALRGRFTPAAALHRLLAGTGHTASFTGPRSAVVYRLGAGLPAEAARREAAMTLDLDLAEVRAVAPVRIGRPDPRPGLDYARRTELEIQDVLADDPAYRGKPFRLRIAVDTDGSGRISQVRVARADTTEQDRPEQGRPDQDRKVSSRLLGHQLASAPPPGLVQPMWFDIEVGRLFDDGRDRRP